MNENTVHAERILKLIKKRYDFMDNGAVAISDVIADLQHLADLHGFDWDEIIDRAHDYYMGDLEEHGGKASRRKQDWTPRGE